MHTTKQLTKEIAELNAVKLAYNYFLGSYDALLSVENTTAVMHNLTVIQQSIRELYCEMEEQKSHKLNNRSYGFPHAAIENNAIFHFNHDKRFRITE